MRTALIAGSTGLIGKQLLSLLLDSNRYDKVIALTRKEFDLQHPKLEQVITDLHTLKDVTDKLKADDVFCCLGTTMAKAKTKEKFYEVDFKYALEVAKATQGLGAKQFLLVSALGADKKSSIYYNRVKGEIEEAISALNFTCTHIFRPSLLLGARNENRPGEDAAKLLYKIFGFAIPEKFRAVDGGQVASAMFLMASKDHRGVFVHESRDIQKMR